jgi:hypothetical protein
LIAKLERLVYDLVKYNSGLKDILKFFYQFAFCFMGRAKPRFLCPAAEVYELDSFFGFHDRASMNYDKEVLGHRSVGQFVDGAGTANIYVFDLKRDKANKKIASTRCCNYQQGSLLTWYSKDEIIYNDFENGAPVTLVRNIRTGACRKMRFHFFSLSPGCRFVTSINFKRFGVGMPGYGYNVAFPSEIEVDAKTRDSNNPVSDLFIFDLEREHIVKRFSISRLKQLSFNLIDDGYFYFSHTGFSPDGDGLFFLLRASNSKYNSSQLFFFDISKDVLTPLASGGMVSHLCWLDQNEILAYCNTRASNDFGYNVFNVKTGQVRKFDTDLPAMDGHPHSIGGGAFLTDTYPDRYRRQKAFEVMSDGRRRFVLDVYSPMKFRGINRVDFHPRPSQCNKYFTVDSPHSGVRSQLVICRDIGRVVR